MEPPGAAQAGAGTCRKRTVSDVRICVACGLCPTFHAISSIQHDVPTPRTHKQGATGRRGEG